VQCWGHSRDRIRVGRLVIDRRREDALLQRLDAHQRLQRARRAEQMTRHGLGRADRELSSRRAKHLLDGGRLALVVSCVEVPCAFKYPMSSGASPDWASAARIARRRSLAGLLRRSDVIRIGGCAIPQHLGIDARGREPGRDRGFPARAPRRLRRSTNPSAVRVERARSLCGASLRRLTAVITLNPATASGTMPASAPPDTTTSAAPRRIVSVASRSHWRCWRRL